MTGSRVLALLAAVPGVLFLGHTVYIGIQYGRFAWISLLLGLAFAAVAVYLERGAVGSGRS